VIEMSWRDDGQCCGIDIVSGIVLERGSGCFVGEAVEHAEEFSGEAVAELDVFTEIVSEHCGRSFETLEPAEEVYSGAPE